MKVHLVVFREHVRLPDGRVEATISMATPNHLKGYSLELSESQRLMYVKSKLDTWVICVPLENVRAFTPAQGMENPLEPKLPGRPKKNDQLSVPA